MVKNKYLLLNAAIVYFFAGFNVLKIGVGKIEAFNPLLIFLQVAVFTVFYFKIFKGLLEKHTRRIYSVTKDYFWRFFDRKTYMIMFFMMTFGMLLRLSPHVPAFFIAFFYTGVGAALLFTAYKFLSHFIMYHFNGGKYEKIV